MLYFGVDLSKLGIEQPLIVAVVVLDALYRPFL